LRKPQKVLENPKTIRGLRKSGESLLKNDAVGSALPDHKSTFLFCQSHKGDSRFLVNFSGNCFPDRWLI
jgi:hypothetical protein